MKEVNISGPLALICHQFESYIGVGSLAWWAFGANCLLIWRWRGQWGVSVSLVCDFCGFCGPVG